MINYITFFSLILIFHLSLMKYSREIINIFLVSIFIKLILIFMNNNFFYLMDGGADALNFHKHMVMFLDGGKEFIFLKGLHDIYALSQIGAYVYALFGEDIIFMQLISLCISSSTLIIFYLCLKEFNLKVFHINLSCFIFLFHPFLLNYSILTMRETYSFFLMLSTLLFFFKYFNTKKVIYIIGSVIIAIPIYYINGGLLISYFIFFIFVIKPIIIKKKSTFLKKILATIFLITCLFIFLYVLVEIANVPYLRNMKQFLINFNPDIIISAQKYIQNNAHSNASYPEFLLSDGTFFDFALKSIVRYFYFMFSPFPWDIVNLRQVIGLLDPFIHLLFLIIIFKNYSELLKNEKLFFLIVLYVTVTFTYSFGVGNFGQGIRHKTKFVPILMILSSAYYFKTYYNLLSTFSFIKTFQGYKNKKYH